uniref:FABP domain-containing protein n=1 Tax=Trichuris muris TaxID=70415 RepID=A0A5S6QY04_TRIMR
MSKKLVGKYKLASSENFEAFMKELGVNFMLRKIAHNAVVIVEIIEEDDGFWILKNDSTFRHLQVRFRLGEPVEEVTPDGRHVLTTFTLDEDKLIQHQKATKNNEKDTIITRELRDGKLITTCQCEDVTCVRVLHRIN